MKATRFEFGFRIWIAVLIYILGFWAPWSRYGSSAAPVTTAWLELSGEASRWLSLQTASVLVTSIAILLAATATGLRLWSTAHDCSEAVQSGPDWRGAKPQPVGGVPLYLGSFLFTVAISILMPPSGAVFAIVASFVQMLRLILRSKARWPEQETRGEVCIARAAAQPKWGQAFIGEIFYVAMTACLAVLAWRYNAILLIQALLICFGLSLVVRAFAGESA